MIRPDPEEPVATHNSEGSATPTETALHQARVGLRAQRDAIDQIMRTRRVPETRDAVFLEIVATLGRAEAVLEMAAEAIRAYTDQKLVENKIQLALLRQERERSRSAGANERRIDLVLTEAIGMAKNFVTDARVITAVGTSIAWIVGQFLAGGGSIGNIGP